MACFADLKVGNVLLKMEVASTPGGSDGSRLPNPASPVKEQLALVAKVADFGLATRLDDTETHVSGVHRVRHLSRLQPTAYNVLRHANAGCTGCSMTETRERRKPASVQCNAAFSSSAL